MARHNSIIDRSRSGEIICNNLNRHIRDGYKSDTILDNSVVPWVIMAFCAAVDLAVFLDLFMKILYNSPVMIAVMVGGFLFAFDFVPIFCGIHLKRMREHLARGVFVVVLSAIVFFTACGINTALRITTMDQIAPDATNTNTDLFGAVQDVDTKTDEEAERERQTALALTIFSIGLPILTSIGSLAISYVTYHPLKERKKTAEKTLCAKKDEVRRFNAIISEFEQNKDFGNKLKEIDKRKYEAMRQMHRAKVLSYAAFVRQRLMEHLANPVATSALSCESCQAILDKLDRELALIDTGHATYPTNVKPNS